MLTFANFGRYKLLKKWHKTCRVTFYAFNKFIKKNIVVVMNVVRIVKMKPLIESGFKKNVRGVYLAGKICFNSPTLNKL